MLKYTGEAQNPRSHSDIILRSKRLGVNRAANDCADQPLKIVSNASDSPVETRDLCAQILCSSNNLARKRDHSDALFPGTSGC
jgi:hypothetical protein